MKLSAYRAIAKSLNADLESVFKKHGFAATKINTGVDERMGTVRLSIQLRDLNQTDATGAATTPERELFKRHAALHGLDPSMLDRKIKLGGAEFEVAGLKSRGSKCVLLRNISTNKMHVAVPDYVKMALGRAS